MLVKFLGGVREVGRSAIYLADGDRRFLLDAGVMLSGREVKYPMHIPPREVDEIIITHAHLDHIGAAPIFFIGLGRESFLTKLTAPLAKLILLDFIRVSKGTLPFEVLEVDRFIEKSEKLEYGQEISRNGFKLMFLQAGHTPGGGQVLLEFKGKRILYTGDINTVETTLLKGAFTDYPPIDVAIVESTYANKNHPLREEIERKFVEKLKEVVERKGIVLVPAFGIGRSQEVITILAKYSFPYDVYYDGMARAVTQILFDFPDWLSNPNLLEEAAEEVIWVNTQRQREEALKNPGVIVTPAGMLQGGPVNFYLKKVGDSKKNLIAFVSYQVEGTPGRILLEKGVITVDGKFVKAKSEIRHFELSSHSGKDQLEKLIKKINADKTFIVHGEPENCERLAKYAREELELEAFAPKLGESYTI
ncbi:MAG: MBL fold metallo-hydrolase [Crenarchaeota archaeon]|nr:MBL fold metallo-hydrolase [Thermoproteota archaeon]MDW8033721.1 MBL fold metallo-hydrolase [Nitrososphaerota archaeon]